MQKTFQASVPERSFNFRREFCNYWYWLPLCVSIVSRINAKSKSVILIYKANI